MNTIERRKSAELTYQIAHLLVMFRAEFPEAIAELPPWFRDTSIPLDTIPSTIQLSFNLANRYPQHPSDAVSHCVTVHIQVTNDEPNVFPKMMGLVIEGHNDQGCQWRLSTMNHCKFEGDRLPPSNIQTQLKRFCLNVFRFLRMNESTTTAEPWELIEG